MEFVGHAGKAGAGAYETSSRWLGWRIERCLGRWLWGVLWTVPVMAAAMAACANGEPRMRAGERLNVLLPDLRGAPVGGEWQGSSAGVYKPYIWHQAKVSGPSRHVET